MAPSYAGDDSVEHEERSSLPSFDLNGDYEDSISTAGKELMASQHVSCRPRGGSSDLNSEGEADSVSMVSGPDDVVAFSDLPPETDVFISSATKPEAPVDDSRGGDDGEGLVQEERQISGNPAASKKGVTIKPVPVVVVADTPGVPSSGASLASESSDEIHHGAANVLSMKGVSLKGEADEDSLDASESRSFFVQLVEASNQCSPLPVVLYVSYL